MGISPGLTKVYSYCLGCFFGGIAGGVGCYAHKGVSIELFNLRESVEYLGMAIIGGLGTVAGSVFGGVTIKSMNFLLSRFAERMTDLYHLEGSSLSIAIAPICIGGLTIAMLMIQPKGLSYLWQVTKVRVKLWPFKP